VSGGVYTRTGRRFFDDWALEASVLERLRGAFSQLGFCETLRTDWAVLDCEILPVVHRFGGLHLIGLPMRGASGALANRSIHGSW